MDKRLIDIKNGKYDNCLLPFYWQQGNHTAEIPSQIDEIYRTGARAVCIESRTHSDFGGDGWWRDLQIIIDECEKRNMKLWILDDCHFPTGYANGAVKSHPELRKRFCLERHIDVIGPRKNVSIMVQPFCEDDILIGAYMYKRLDGGEKISREYIDISGNVHDGLITFDVPSGAHRIFLLFCTHHGADDAIDMMNPESVDLLINAVYEPHFKHFSQYFGNVISGFFSDEPQFGNFIYEWGIADPGFYGYKIGVKGLSLPYSDELIGLLSQTLGENAKPLLPALWYDMGTITAKVRAAFMDAATTLYRRHFSERLGGWCERHNVEYIGHIIEDNNCHTGLGHSAGHYFRAMSGQHMSGVDIVYQQVEPGFAHYGNKIRGAGIQSDSAFFHYVLAQLAASSAHIDKSKRGRAMAEVFGAGGWAEGSQTCKWLIDFLLVRGVNHFVPHAFSPSFPNPDCPPHFGANGCDPQYDGFCSLMDYTNKASYLLSHGAHIAEAALMYHAESEWADKDDFEKVDNAAKSLLDGHIAYDIIPADAILQSEVINGNLCINGEQYKMLAVPYSHYYSEKLLNKLNDMQNLGLDVVFLRALPDNCGYDFDVTTSEALAHYYKAHHDCDITVNADFPLLRHYHIRRDNHDIFMFFNESVTDTADFTVNVGISGRFARLDMLNDTETIEDCGGEFALKLSPYQSNIIVFGEDRQITERFSLAKSEKITPKFQISAADYTNMSGYKPLVNTADLDSVAAQDGMSRFSGKLKYECIFSAQEHDKCILEFENVSQNIRLYVNGQDCGIRICKPFRFDITEYIHGGENELCAIVSNTLVFALRDDFSTYQILPPSGIYGDITLNLYNSD